MPELASVRITPLDGHAVVQLKAWTAGADPAVWGIEVEHEARLLKLGPDEWILVSDRLEGPELCERVNARMARVGISVIDVSCALKTLRVEGDAARDVLSSGCGLDLHPRAFPPGCCTRTRFVQLAVVIDCTRDDCFELYVGRSYISYLKSWVDDAAYTSGEVER